MTAISRGLRDVTSGIPPSENPHYLIGEHQLIQKINQLITKVAVTEATILIMGESGTGK